MALGLAAAAKVHPAGLGPWFVGRLIRDRGRPEARAWLVVIAAAAGTVGAVLVLSFVFGGAALWEDYVPVAGAASGARLLDPRNVGPAAQLALLLGGDEALVRTLHLPVAIGAVAASLLAGLAIRDRLTGIAIAAIASLVVLPVTWYHYPVALIPFAVAAVARARGTSAAGRRGRSSAEPGSSPRCRSPGSRPCGSPSGSASPASCRPIANAVEGDSAPRSSRGCATVRPQNVSGVVGALRQISAGFRRRAHARCKVAARWQPVDSSQRAPGATLDKCSRGSRT